MLISYFLFYYQQLWIISNDEIFLLTITSDCLLISPVSRRRRRRRLSLTKINKYERVFSSIWNEWIKNRYKVKICHTCLISIVVNTNYLFSFLLFFYFCSCFGIFLCVMRGILSREGWMSIRWDLVEFVRVEEVKNGRSMG